MCIYINPIVHEPNATITRRGGFRAQSAQVRCFQVSLAVPLCSITRWKHAAHAAVLVRVCSKALRRFLAWLREGGNLMNAACMLRESYTSLAYCMSAKAYGFAVLVRLGHKCPLLCKRDQRPLPLVGGYTCGYCIPQVSSKCCRYPSASPSHRPLLREHWLLRRKCERRCLLWRPARILLPGVAVAHVGELHASLWLCRMRLVFAFDLVSPANSWKLGVWRGCDASVPPQAGIS